MPSALPSGWVDTGISKTLTASGSVQLHSANTGGSGSLPSAASFIPQHWDVEAHINDAWRLYYRAVQNSSISCPPTGSTNHVDYGLYLQDETGTFYLIETSDVCGIGPPPSTTAIYDFSFSQGPFRLGVSYSPGSGGAPQYVQQGGVIQYAWFADENTVTSTTVAGHTVTVSNWMGPTYIGLTPGALSLYAGEVGSEELTGTTLVEYTGVSWMGAPVDTSGIAAASGGGLTVSSSGSGNISFAQTATNFGVDVFNTIAVRLPITFVRDVAVSKNGSSNGSYGAAIVPSWVLPGDPTVIGDGVTSYNIPQNSWTVSPFTLGTGLSFSLSGAWMLSSNLDNGHRWDTDGINQPDSSLPVLDSAYDAQLYIWPSPARFDPASAPQPYSPVLLSLPSLLSIHRSSGVSLADAAYITSDGTKLTINEYLTHTDFIVTTTGAKGVRTLKTNWRNYIDMSHPGGVLSNPNALVDTYSVTKHNWWEGEYNAGRQSTHQTIYPEDVWWWAAFGWLVFYLTSAVDWTLTVKLNWSTIDVEDSHVTGSQRLDDMVITTGSGSAIYSTLVHAGTNQQAPIDLLFPDAGGPIQPGRIDSIELSGFPVGMTTLLDVALLRKDAPYLKWADGVPLRRELGHHDPDYSAIVIDCDGSVAYNDVPDTLYKAQETYNGGGGERYVEPLTGYPSGIVEDGQFSLTAMINALNRQENLSATYDSAAADTALLDPYGSRMGPELAQWILPVLPYSSTLALPCLPRCQTFIPCAGHSFNIVARLDLGTGIEVLVYTTDGKRCPAGRMVNILNHLGAVVATGVTDNMGVCWIPFVFANGDEAYTAVAI